jgi:Na+/melibiose symporter-like transporter
MSAVYNLIIPLVLQGGVGPASPGFGFSPAVTGLIMAVDNLVSLVLLPLVGAWSDRIETRWGRRFPFILASFPIRTLAFMLLPFVLLRAGQNALAAFLGVILVYLLAAKVMAAPFQALLSDWVSGAELPRANGLVRFLDGSGALLGSFILVPLYMYHDSLPFLGGAGLFLGAMLLIFLVLRPWRRPAPERMARPETLVKGVLASGRYRHLLTAPLWFLLLCNFLLNFAMQILGTFFSSFAIQEMGLPASAAGRYYAVPALAFMLTVIPAGFLVGRLGKAGL